MKRKDVKHIAHYYEAIPGMLKLLKREREALEEEYNGLCGIAMDGMPHSQTPGKPVESLAVCIAESGVSERLREITEREQQLVADRAVIRAHLDTLNDRYNRVLVMRYVSEYSWSKISVQMHTPESTVRHWHEMALERLGEAMEEVAGISELIVRATRARI